MSESDDACFRDHCMVGLKYLTVEILLIVCQSHQSASVVTSERLHVGVLGLWARVVARLVAKQ